KAVPLFRVGRLRRLAPCRSPAGVDGLGSSSVIIVGVFLVFGGWVRCARRLFFVRKRVRGTNKWERYGQGVLLSRDRLTGHGLSPAVAVSGAFCPLWLSGGEGRGEGVRVSWDFQPPHPFPLPHWPQNRLKPCRTSTVGERAWRVCVPSGKAEHPSEGVPYTACRERPPWRSVNPPRQRPCRAGKNDVFAFAPSGESIFGGRGGRHKDARVVPARAAPA